MCHALADTRGLRPPSVRPNHLAAPSRQRAPWDVPPPLAKILGSQSDLLVRRAGRDHPFPVSAGSTSGPQRLVCRIPCSGQAQCTSRRDFAPFSSSTHRAFHGERAGKNDRGGLGLEDGCKVRSARTRYNTKCINQGNIKRAQGCCPWSPPQGDARDQSASASRRANWKLRWT
jgi:hypothetical protein